MTRTSRLFPLILTLVLGTSLAFAQAPAATPAATPAPAAAAAPAPITDADLKAIDAPKADARAKGDPDGALTGTVADVAVADSKKEVGS